MPHRPFRSCKAAFLALLFLAVACKKDEPTTPDPTEPEPEPKKLVINFSMVNGNEEASLDDAFVDEHGQWMLPTTFKLYVSNLELVTSDQGIRPLADVELIDFEPFDPNINNPQWGHQVAYEVESGTFNALQFSIGVPPELNGVDPATYENEHPLSIFASTYWSWASMYRFVIFEARGSKEGIGDNAGTLVYHIGTDPLYTAPLNLPVAVNMDSEANDTVEVQIDLSRLFDPQDGIDFSVDFNTHTVENPEEYELAERFMERLVFSVRSAP